ncbi:energy-dependent translational throttle protein EttA [bacterium]|jgi:ATP-binding cassette ChvD family protein|nr:energy-dependent translational throttle protein EttA [Alphaproteobacteria bacterium]MDA9174276.1 energy-dependent translational throttle protein EttA [bacterium]MDB2478833.1 energy-dependent translational throttle protein EttA [Alphaproteobacteria bacterium]MDB2583683.1 energy-dependent translational throttle protein EttA [Alphaproteobacteria bacterium]
MNNPQYIFSMYKLNKVYPGGKQVIKDISLSFLPGAKIGVLGGNGAGKSTLLKIMAGLDTDYNGDAKLAEGIKVGYLAQEPELNNELNVYENVMEGMAEAKKIVDDFNAISLKFSEDLSEDEMNETILKQAELQEMIDNMDAWDLERKAEIAMDALSLPPASDKIDHLSGGEKRRVALAKLLLSNPDFLLLDEPTNHLDALSVAWLQRFLHDFPGTVVTITHDRYFLDEVAGWILELDRGEGIPYKGNYSGWLEQKQKRLELEGKIEEARKRKLNEELEWIKAAPRARQAKSKARISSYEELVAREQKKEINVGNLVIPPAPRLGSEVISFDNVSKSFGEKLLIDSLSFKLPPGGIIGVIGANGAGKTTLFRLITQEEKPDNGEILIGETVNLNYVDQSRDVLKPEKNVWESICDGLDEIQIGKKIIQSRAYVGQFNFKGSDQQKIVSQLSGGERNRVHLARTLKIPGNVLLLDEPTNDLDVDTLRSLEEAILEFSGCVVVISHDRWFLNKLATHILAFEGDSHVEWFEGNYQDYENDKKRRLGEESLNPKRMKYKPIIR